MTATHIYISGPMRAKDGFNFPAFFEAEAEVRRIYPEADICNPAREDVERFGLQHLLKADPTGLSAGRYLMQTAEFGETELRQALGGDLAYICEKCDMLVLLPGWEESSGARSEAATAQALGIPIVFFDQVGGAEGLECLSKALKGLADQSPMPALDAPEAQSSQALDPETGEVRATSASGGQKGVKLAAFDQISPGVLWEVAEHFGRGARKYAAHNFRRGYPWSQSFSALCRHLWEFWGGKEWDVCGDRCPTWGNAGESEHGPICENHTGSRVIIAVIWHAMCLAEFSRYPKFKEYDDRYVYEEAH